PASFRRLGERAADAGPEVRILRDITGRSTCEGTLEDFTKYFRHRFRVLQEMLRRHREFGGAQDIAKAKRSTREIRIIGMVADVRTTKNGHRILELEDDTERVPVLLPADSPLASETVVPDEVVGIVGTVNGKGLVISALPDRLAVVLLPGNHDAVRPAEPQPAFPTSIQKLFDSNVIFAGNPSVLSIEGVRILAYHGRSMDDLVSSIPGLSYQRPLDG